MIFETKTICTEITGINVDDIVETNNHLRCVDLIIDNVKNKLTEKFIKTLHFNLKVGTNDSQKSWFKVGDYKLKPNEVNGQETTQPEQVKTAIKKLLENYNNKQSKLLKILLLFIMILNEYTLFKTATVVLVDSYV